MERVGASFTGSTITLKKEGKSGDVFFKKEEKNVGIFKCGVFSPRKNLP